MNVQVYKIGSLTAMSRQIVKMTHSASKVLGHSDQTPYIDLWGGAWTTRNEDKLQTGVNKFEV